MINGKRYLIIKKQENGCYPIKLAYWFDERTTNNHTYVDGFYRSEHFYYPHKNVIAYVDMDKLPKFTKWKIEEPVEGERYLVYRVGSTSWYSQHYTIRKYHNGSFGSKDVKYWIKLSEVMKHEFNGENWRNMMDRNKTSMYENGYENGYSDGFRIMLDTIKEKLDECVCTGEYPSGEDYKYIPYEYYEEVMKGLME